MGWNELGWLLVHACKLVVDTMLSRIKLCKPTRENFNNDMVLFKIIYKALRI